MGLPNDDDANNFHAANFPLCCSFNTTAVGVLREYTEYYGNVYDCV